MQPVSVLQRCLDVAALALQAPWLSPARTAQARQTVAVQSPGFRRLEVGRRWPLDLWLRRLEVGRRSVVNLRFRRLNVGSGPLFNLHIGGRGAQGRTLLRRRPVPGSPGQSRNQRGCHEDREAPETLQGLSIFLIRTCHEFSVLDAAKQRH